MSLMFEYNVFFTLVTTGGLEIIKFLVLQLELRH
jgi:hypothetical protein